jgi:hypothetical protein
MRDAGIPRVASMGSVDRVNNKTLTMSVNDVVDHFKIVSDDKPVDLSVSAIVLVVPADSQ